MGNRRDYLIHNIVKVCEKLDRKGFVANHDGNVSVKFEEHLLATPTAEAKAEIIDEMIITLDESGKKIEGIGKPFSEIKLHIAAYNARPDAMAVVHAHPPHSTARGLVGISLQPALPEAIVSVGDIIPVADYAMPGSVESEETLKAALKINDIVFLPGNGVIAIGDDLEQAYLRLELVEHLCKIDSYARSLGTPMELPADDRRALMQKRASIGLGPQNRDTRRADSSIPTNDSSSNELKELIANEIRKALQGNS